MVFFIPMRLQILFALRSEIPFHDIVLVSENTRSKRQMRRTCRGRMWATEWGKRNSYKTDMYIPLLKRNTTIHTFFLPHTLLAQQKAYLSHKIKNLFPELGARLLPGIIPCGFHSINIQGQCMYVEDKIAFGETKIRLEFHTYSVHIAGLTGMDRPRRYEPRT